MRLFLQSSFSAPAAKVPAPGRALLTLALGVLLCGSPAVARPQAQLPLEQPITLQAQSETVHTVLGQLEKQANVRFFYSRQLIGANRRVSVVALNTPLAEVLRDLLPPLHIRYETVEGGIVLTPSEAMPAAGGVTGRVVDNQGAGLPGVTVLVEGSTLGSTTGPDGRFALSGLPAGEHTLVISFVGFGTVRRPVTVTDGQTLSLDNVALSESATQLTEAVVVGYGTARRQDVTGAVATVSSRDFVQGQVTSPERLIQGKVAGVQITAGGGAPGEVSVIRIRGGSSLNSSNDPLVVIDGVPLDGNGIAGAGNPLALVNPNDIETFTVLKDASATAIYGSRASNGVIIITTKKGKDGQPLRVTLSSQVSRSENYGRISVLGGDEYRALIEQGIADGKIPSTARIYLGKANTDWQKEIYQTAWTSDNSVSLTGSVRHMPFRASLGYLDQDGTLRTGNLKRNTASLNLTPRLFKERLQVSVNAKGTWADYRFADQGAIGSAINFDPTHPVKDGREQFDGYFEWTNVGDPKTPYNLAPRNPVAMLTDRRDRSTVLRGIGNVQFDYQLPFFPDLRANLNLGYDISRSAGTVFVPASSSLAATSRGLSNRYRQEKDTKLLEFYLNYTRQLNPDNRLEVLAGYSYQDFLRYSPFFPTLTAEGTKFDPTVLDGLPDKSQYTLVSFYGRANYSLKDRYLLTATLRADGSSHFRPGRQFGYFPAASAAWRLSQEDFLKESGAVSELKLRASYGITGQQDVFTATGTDYPFLARYTLGDGYVRQQFGSEFIRTYRPAAYDRDLKWEETTTYNLGLDYGFLDNVLTGSVDVYLRNTKDLLAITPQPAGSTLSDQQLTNIGSLRNKGLEFALNYNAIRGEKLNLSFNFNATFNRNEITKLNATEDPAYLGARVGGISNGTIQIQSVGYAANSFYVLKQKYNSEGKPIDPGTGAAGLLLAYEDLNNDGQINNLDYYRYKSPAPQAILGFSSNLGVGHASLAFTVRSNIGNYVYDNVSSARGAYSSVYPALPFLLNTTPSIYATGFANSQFYSDYYLHDASFVRLENVTLGYDFGSLLRTGSTLRLTLAGQNLLLLSGYGGLNPELPNGIDNNFYPLPRTFTLGLNLGF